MLASDPTAPSALGPPIMRSAHERPIVIDGGLATELERRGNDLSDRLWSARLLLEAPESIVTTHLAYYRAGAQVAITASYQASFEGFARRGLDQDAAADLMRRSVALAHEARRRRRAEVAVRGAGVAVAAGSARTVASSEAASSADRLLVAASIGPYGAVLADGSEYRGDDGLTVRQLADWHRPRSMVLGSAGPDLLACETIPSVREGAALVALLDETDGPPAWLAFTCADGARTRAGEPVEAAFALADASDRVVAVGINCTDPRFVEELVARARATTSKAIVAYPNSGRTWDPAGRRWIGHDRGLVDGPAARRWVAAGASLVGGCCGVGPDRIAAIAAALDPSTGRLTPARSST